VTFAAKRFGNDGRFVMIPVAGKILDRDLGVRDACADQSLDIAYSHGHGARLVQVLDSP